MFTAAAPLAVVSSLCAWRVVRLEQAERAASQASAWTGPHMCCTS